MTLVVLRRLLVLGVVVALALPGVGYVQTMNRAALVVQFEDGSSRNMCVAFAEPEINGLELLKLSEIDYIEQPTGMGAAICKIDGVGCDFPAEDCFCKSEKPTERYWQLFNSTNGTWSYSNRGVSYVKIRDGSAQAFVWGPNGIKAGDSVNFADICPAPTVGSPTNATQQPAATPAPTRRPPVPTPRAPSTRTPLASTATTRPAPTNVRPSPTVAPSATHPAVVPTAVVPTATVAVPTSTRVAPSATVQVVPTPQAVQPTDAPIVLPTDPPLPVVVPTDAPLPVAPTTPPAVVPTDTAIPSPTVGFSASGNTTAYPFGFGTAVTTVEPAATSTVAVPPTSQPSPTSQPVIAATVAPTQIETALAAGGTDAQPPSDETSGGGSVRDPLLFVAVCVILGIVIWKLRQRQQTID